MAAITVLHYMHQNATKAFDANNTVTPAQLFRVLGDPTRLRILRLLATARSELCVCEFVDCLEEPQYKVSRHLKALRAAGLLRERKEGRWVYHYLSDSDSPFLASLLQAVSSLPPLIKEQKELKKRLAIRVDGKCLLGVQKPNLFLCQKAGKVCKPGRR